MGREQGWVMNFEQIKYKSKIRLSFSAMDWFAKTTAMILTTLWLAPNAHAYSITNGELVEDFSSLSGADLANSTGLWNTVSGVAMAAAVVNSNPAQTISFGDGSDGVLNVSSGTVSFDTDARPNGYNYQSITIGAGATISVTGSNPLILRSLSTVNIAANIDISGMTGANSGTANVTTASSGTTTGRACAGTGGAGGAVTAGPAFAAGADGLSSTGAAEGNAGAANGADGSPATTTSFGANFYGGGFICGGGGGGGASRVDGANFITGASGGSGGGAIRITAVGNLTTAFINAAGGTGGAAATNGVNCSGNGGGGGGGAVWLQTLATLSTGADPMITAGNGGAGGGCGLGTGASFDGQRRGDSASGARPAWAGALATNNTDNAASGNVSYTVMSRALDLGVFNATFTTNPVVQATTPSDSTATVSYAGSRDGSTFGGFVTDIKQLSGAGYRYIRFRIDFRTATAAAASPTVTSIRIPFGDAGPGPVEATLTTGCSFLGLKKISNHTASDEIININHSRERLKSFLIFWMGILVVYSLFKLSLRRATETS